ncbi:hypothetical protein WJN01_07560 [Flavobacteriaceae bacterium SZ-1-7]|uniref:hypothetical protein n=1 Tax=Tamlana sedimenti TaxID=3134126 RepID=UPI003124387A
MKSYIWTSLSTNVIIFEMKYFNYVLIIIGAFVAMYAKAGEEQNQLILIVGIVLLMVGVYRIARTIPSKNDSDKTDNSESEQ